MYVRERVRALQLNWSCSLVAGCSGLTVLTDEVGYFGVEKYDNDLSCQWRIQAPFGGVSIHINRFELHGHFLIGPTCLISFGIQIANPI